MGGLLDGIADTDEKKKRYLLAVQTRTEDLEKLVDKLSYYNKIENHSFHYQMEEACLKDLVEEYIGENEEFISRNRLLIIRVYGDEGRILMDRGEFRRILDNLLMNSIRYREKEASRICITIEKKQDRIFWGVADDGPGVPEDALEKIFESFCRLDKSRTRCREGSGLGLAIVKRIVIDHRGIPYARNRNGLEICMEFPAV